MDVEPFSEPWARSWGEALASSRGFSQAARGFRGSVAFVVTDGPSAGDDRAVAVEIDDGRCVSARPVPLADVDRARFALGADPIAWRGILDGSVEPANAVLSGRVRLLRGSLLTIAPHLALARELLHAARWVNRSGHGASADT